FTRQPMPLLPAMLLQAQAGDGAEVAEQDVPYPMPAPNQSLAHLPTPSRPQTSDPVALVLEHDHSSDPYETAGGSFLTIEDAPLGGDFHTSPLRSSHAPHVGKLVKKVKTLEVKLKTKKRKMVVSNSDKEEGNTQDVDLDALRALANAAVAVDSDIPSGSTLQIPAASLCTPTVVPLGASNVPPGAFDVSLGASDAPTSASTVPSGTSAIPAAASAVPAGNLNVPAAVTSSGAPAGVSGEEAAKWLHDEEMAQMEKERAEVKIKRQQEVLDSAMYYNESDWLNIRAQVKANASLSKTLLGDDVFEDNFPARMAA
nr:hypothetical protein [Tanacetum cinerariifolium]